MEKVRHFYELMIEKSHLQRVGLSNVSGTDLFLTPQESILFQVNFTNPEMKYRFYQNVDDQMETFGIKAVSLSEKINLLHLDGRYNNLYAREYDGIGMSGQPIYPDGEEYEKLHVLRDIPLAQQLTNSGFASPYRTKDVQVWKTSIGEEDKKREFIFVTRDNTVLRFLKSFDPYLLRNFPLNRQTHIRRVYQVPNQSIFSPSLEERIQLENPICYFSIEPSGWVTDVELKKELMPEEIGLEKYKPHPDKSSPEFIVGGINSSETIQNLQRLNGRTIAELEAIMRPLDIDNFDALPAGTTIDETSFSGFLGLDDNLLETLINDNEFVLSRGLTHQQMAFPVRYISQLFRLGYIHHDKTFSLQGYKYKAYDTGRGTQHSPFGDGAIRGGNVVIQNVTDGVTSEPMSLLVGDLVERWGFYEGQGTKYRLSPTEILELFPFLLKK